MAISSQHIAAITSVNAQSSSSQRENTKIQSIEVLRGYAAFCVFIFHARVPLFTPWPQVNEFLASATLLGNIGVDLFFVISGFVIAWACVLTRPVPESIREFAIKRFFRVVPLYWLATIASGFAIDRLFLGISDWPRFFKSLAFYPSSPLGPPFFNYAQLITGWTLNYEIFFYIVFAVCLLAGRWVLALAPAVLISIIVGSQLFAGHPMIWHPFQAPTYEWAYVSLITNPLLLEFVIGIGTALLYKVLRNKLPAALVIFGLIASVTLYIFSAVIYQKGGHHWFYLGLPAAALVLSLALAEKKFSIQFPKWMMELGALSYAIYLFHPFVLKIGKELNNHAAHSLLIGIFSCVLQTVLLIWLARKVHSKLELPLIAMGRRLVGRLKY